MAISHFRAGLITLPWLVACGATDEVDFDAGPALPGHDGAVVQDAGYAGYDATLGLPGAPGGGSTGGNPSGGADSCAGINAAAEAKLLPVDIIWAIDDSGSMIPSFPAIHAALNRFSSDIAAAGIDAHIVLLAGQGICVPAPLGSGQCGSGGGIGGGGLGGGLIAPPRAPDSKAPNFLHLGTPFGYSAGMGVILDNFPHYKQMLRPNARTHLVLTEDGAPPMAAAAVVDHVEGRRGATAAGPWSPALRPATWTFNGVVCKSGLGGGACLTAFQVPATTLSLIESTGGVLADLSQAGAAGADPFASLLQALAAKVIVGAELSCEYDIPPAPAGQAFDRNLVNVLYSQDTQPEKLIPRAPAACDANSTWRYDNDTQPSKIVLCPAACSEVRARQGAKLRVQFGCATTVLL